MISFIKYNSNQNYYDRNLAVEIKSLSAWAINKNYKQVQLPRHQEENPMRKKCLKAIVQEGHNICTSE